MPNKTLRDIAIEIGINVNTLKSRIYRAEEAGKPKARRERETKRRSPLWKRNGDISLVDRCPKCGGGLSITRYGWGSLPILTAALCAA